jgi:RimJ/RimL family protein N-acetyltransferase
VLAFNAPVIKLHHKFGFVEEGVFRQHHKVDDTYIDIYRLGLLQVDWSIKRTEMLNKLTALHKG